MGFSSGAGDGDRDTHTLHPGNPKASSTEPCRCVQCHFLNKAHCCVEVRPIALLAAALSLPTGCQHSTLKEKENYAQFIGDYFRSAWSQNHINNLQCLRKLSQIFERLSRAHCAGQQPHLGHSVVEERKQNTDIPDWPMTAHQPSQFSVLPPRAGVQVPR